MSISRQPEAWSERSDDRAARGGPSGRPRAPRSVTVPPYGLAGACVPAELAPASRAAASVAPARAPSSRIRIRIHHSPPSGRGGRGLSRPSTTVGREGPRDIGLFGRECNGSAPTAPASRSDGSTAVRVGCIRPLRTGGDDHSFAFVGERCGWVVGVDLAGEAVAVEDAVGDQAGGDAVADAVEGLDALGVQGLFVGFELVVEGVVGEALGDEDDAVGFELEWF